MSKIDKKRTGEYMLTALTILDERGGDCPSGELITEMAKKLDLSDYEKSLNNSGQHRWVTQFRFYSVGLVKANWIKKQRRVWYLTEEGKQYKNFTSDQIMEKMDKAYNEWYAKRDNDSPQSSVAVEDSDEPDVLMDVRPDYVIFRDLVDGVASGKIQIPPFQRSFVWESKDIRFLLDSIYRGYPIGSFIFWKTTRKLPRSRNVGNIDLEMHSFSKGTEISYVLDGQQRITSLFAAVKGAKIDGDKYRFLFDLKSKKFVVKQGEDNTSYIEEDISNLQISIETIFTESRAAYRSIIRQYPVDYEEVLDNIYDRFVGYRFSVISVMDKETDDEDEKSEGVRQVVDMFSRINETGRKLTVVAKMVARCWGEGYDLSEALEEFYARHKELENIREQTLLQAASVILNHRKSRTRDILSTKIHKLESEWENIVTAFLLAVEFVKTKLKVKNLDYLPFDALLVPLTYLFYQQKSLSNEQTASIEKWFWRACLSNRYDSTVESKLEEDCLEFDKVLEGKEPDINYLIDWEQLSNKLIGQRYNLRNAFVKTVLSLYSYAEPKNLTDGRDIRFEGLFSGYYKHNMHHIFPQAYLRKTYPEQKDYFDSIVNIMLIPAITNLEILDKEPSQYFVALKEANNNLDEILRHHYIHNLDDSGIFENDFMKFLSYRAEILVEAFRVKTGISSELQTHFAINPSKPLDILETRIRSFIHENLKKQTEDSYWEDRIPTDIREMVNRKIKDVIKRHPYGLEEYDRDDVKIQFLDVMDYSKILISNWDVFGTLLGSKQEAEKHFIALKHYRNAIKHGRSINEIDRRTGEAAVLWFESVLSQNYLQE